MTYNWEQKDWLQFQFNESDFTEIARYTNLKNNQTFTMIFH
jgi:hypothetical protein